MQCTVFFARGRSRAARYTSLVWPGSQAIAKAKAYTANAFSLDTLPLSTARLYTFTRPGHSLWSLGHSNSFNPQGAAAPGGPASDRNQINGGLIFFGGGVPLYRDGKIIGGLGPERRHVVCGSRDVQARPRTRRAESSGRRGGRRHRLFAA
jgi:uncharacterized protein GlcG (DUF336 family)